MRLALALQQEEVRYAEEQREGEARLARKKKKKSEDGKNFVDEQPEIADDESEEAQDEDDDEEGDSEDSEIDESLALAWRLQQEDDDRALYMALHGGREPPAGALPRNVSPSQMTYEELNDLGDRLGKVSKGTTREATDTLPTYTFADIFTERPDAVVGTQCAICRHDFQPNDLLKLLPCTHAEHGECLDNWLLVNRRCHICSKEVKCLPRGEGHNTKNDDKGNKDDLFSADFDSSL